MNSWKRLFGGSKPTPVAQIVPQPISPPSNTSTRSNVRAVEPTKRSGADPASRVYNGGARGVEAFYSQMSRDLIAMHGPLVKAEYVSHYPVFEIRFHYRDGAKVVSGQRTGKFDIHFLSLGYVGEGPRYAKAFLDAAGCNRTATEIDQIRPGEVVVPADSKVGRIVDATSPSSVVDNRQPNVSSLGTVFTGLQTDLAVSPGERALALLMRANDGQARVALISLRDNKEVWAKKLASYAAFNETADEIERYSGIAFISADRLIAFGNTENGSAILLLDVRDGSLLSKLTVPETVYRYDRDPLWADARRGIALMSGRGQLLVSMAGDNLSIVRCKPTHLATYNCMMAFGSDSSIYAQKNSSYYRYDNESQTFNKIADGNNDICAHEDGSIICGGGFDDGSGDSYLSVYDPVSNRAERIAFADCVFDVRSAGPGRVLVCYGHGRSSDRDIALVSIASRERHWKKNIRRAQYRGAIICAVPSERWALIQGDDSLMAISLDDSRTLWKRSRKSGEFINGIWVASYRRVYLNRSWGEDDKKGAIDCLEVE